MGSTKPVNTILLGAEILKVLATGPARLEDIYPQVRLNKSSTHRILKTLTQTGLTAQHPVSRTYHIGPLLVKIAADTMSLHHLLILCATPEIRRLRETYRETALIIVPSGDRRMVLKEVRGEQQISLSLGEGSTMPIFVGSSGRVLLSQYEEITLRRILSHMDIPVEAAYLLSDKERLLQEIEMIRRQGYAISTGEMLPGSTGISVPVTGYVCPVALCLFGPKFRFDPHIALEEIKGAAQRIGAQLRSSMNETTPVR